MPCIDKYRRRSNTEYPENFQQQFGEHLKYKYMLPLQPGRLRK